MKKKPIISAITVLSLIPILLFVISFTNYHRYNVEQLSQAGLEIAINQAVIQDGTLRMKNHLEFEFDGYYIIMPYTPSEEKHVIVGQKWYAYNSYFDYLFSELLFDGDNISEDEQQLVFVKEDLIIAVLTLSRSDIDFLYANQAFIAGDAVIYVDQDKTMMIE